MERPPSRVAAATADLLSSLPEHLLDEILQRLGLRDAVRTSALSRAWRRRWESVPGLALSFPDGTGPGVVDRVLLRYTCPAVSRFAFHEVDEASASHAGDWLIALSRRSVRRISLRFDTDERFLLHSSIFSCAARLVSLDLEWCRIPPLPVGFAGFPVLEGLYLSFVTFLDYGEKQLQDIIRGSPRLRALTLQDVDNPVDCVIEAPNLRSVMISSDYDTYDNCRFGELPRLQHAKILVSHFSEPVHGCIGSLAGVAQVRKLSFYAPLDEVTINTMPFTFYNLKSLELATPFSAMNHILLMFCLLRSSPNLEKLKIQIEEKEVVENWEFLNEQWTDGLCACLQIVEIISARLSQCLPISFMKLILSKACLLRTLSVNECPCSQDDPLNELLTCRRASAQAQVVFKVQLKRFC